MATIWDHRLAILPPPPVLSCGMEEPIVRVRLTGVRLMPLGIVHCINNRPSTMVHSNSSHSLPTLWMEENGHVNSPSNTNPLPPPEAIGHQQTGRRTTISEKKKVLEEISYRIERNEKDIEFLNEALKPDPPGLARIILSICAVVLVAVKIPLLVAKPTLECFIYIGIPCFFEIICFEVFSSMYPPMFCVEGWQQIGALIVRHMSLALARLSWFCNWLTMKD